MVAIIKWADIEAEAENSGFRERLVAVFRKYEGQPTDEKTAQGHAVKVTPQSFARHFGVAETTFRQWVKVVDSAITAESTQGKQESNRRFVKSIASQDPEAAAAAATATLAARTAAKTAIKQDEEKEKQKRLAKAGVSKEQREAKQAESKMAKTAAKQATAEWEQAEPTYRGKVLLLQKVGAAFGAMEDLNNFLDNSDPATTNWRDPESIGGALDVLTEVGEGKERAEATLQGALDVHGEVTVGSIVGDAAS